MTKINTAVIIVTACAAILIQPTTAQLDSTSPSEMSDEELRSNFGDTLTEYDENGDGEISIVEADAAADSEVSQRKAQALLEASVRDLTFDASLGGETKKIEVDTWVDTSVGDTLVFGSDGQNELEIEFMRENEEKTSRKMGVMPGIGPGTTSSDPLAIIFPEDRADGALFGVEFNSGTFDLKVEEFSASERSARVKVLPVYPESSDYDCENYDLGENQYAFCSNTNQDLERGAEQEIDLGHTTETLKFLSNIDVEGDRYTTTGVKHRFVNPNTGRTLEFWQQKDNSYKGAGIEIIEWRGLSDEHSGDNMQAVVQVDPAKGPEASLSFEKTNYEPDEEITLNYESFEPGRYDLKVSGLSQDVTKSYEMSDREDTLSFEASQEGRIQAELTAPGTWWNPLESDQTVAEASAQVKTPLADINHEFGEKFSIGEGQSTKIEGRNFYLDTLVRNSEDSYQGVLWRSSEDSDTYSSLTLLRRVNLMKTYGDGFSPYGVVCSVDPETDSAEIVIEENRFNPWKACDRRPDELRSDNDYEIKDYTLGEKVTLEPGEGLEFGESTVYLDKLEEDSFGVYASGYKEWIQPEGDMYWRPPAEGASTTDYFYEGRIATVNCQVNSDEIEIVMERNSETGSNWPEGACANTNEDDRDEGGKLSNSIYLETEDPTASSSVTITASVTDSLDDRGYEIGITGPDGFSLTKQQSRVSFEPDTSGQYTAKLLPLTFANGLPFIGELVQSGAKAETTFEVNAADTSAWIDYCNSNGYKIQSLNQDLDGAETCVSEEIVPAFFKKGGNGQDTQVPESLCQEVLGTRYMENQRACGTPETG
jgi:hypothetical protein